MSNKDRYTENTRKLWYSFIKSLRPLECEICGYDKCLRALHFHHIFAKCKMFNISQFIQSRAFTAKNRMDLRKELELVEILCANCHGELHSRVDATLDIDEIPDYEESDEEGDTSG